MCSANSSSGAVAAVFIIGLVCFSICAARQSHVNAEISASEERAKRGAPASLEAAQRARDALRCELRAGTIEQGKLSARLGDYAPGAELMLWREFLQDPSSAHARWALWDLDRRNTFLSVLAADTTQIRDIAYSPDDAHIATAGDETFICLRNAATGRLITRYPAHGWYMIALAFSTDGSLLATGGDDKHIRIWNPRTGEQLTSFEARNGTVYSVLFAHEPGALYAAGWWSLDRWNTTTWKREASFALSAQASAIDESPTADRNLLASASAHGSARLWDLTSGRCIASFEEFHDWEALSVDFSSDGSLFMVSTADHSITSLSRTPDRAPRRRSPRLDDPPPPA